MKEIAIIWLCSAAAVSLAGFINAYADKKAAKARRARTPEKRFVLYAALGGAAGVLAGFRLFRHKTRHGGLVARVCAAGALNAALFAAAMYLLFTNK